MQPEIVINKRFSSAFPTVFKLTLTCYGQLIHYRRKSIYPYNEVKLRIRRYATITKITEIL